MRDIVEINEELCTGCGQCLLDCAEGALALVDGKAKVIADMYCDGLGACLTGCPTGALRIVQREVAPFDEEAVKEHLARQQRTEPGAAHTPPLAGHAECGCKSQAPFSHGCPGSRAINSGNAHWPLKLSLLRPDAPELRQADILLAADCCAFASARFHQELAGGKRMIIGCPKFEGQDAMSQRLTELFRQAKPASCTVARMEVPCCKALTRACLVAQQASGAQFPVREAVISRQGDITLGEVSPADLAQTAIHPHAPGPATPLFPIS